MEREKSDITVKGKAIYSLIFSMYILSTQTKCIHASSDHKTIYFYSYHTQALTPGLLIPEHPPGLAQTIVLVHVTIADPLKCLSLMVSGS